MSHKEGNYLEKDPKTSKPVFHFPFLDFLFSDNEEDAEPIPLTGTVDQAVGNDIKEMISKFSDNEEHVESSLFTGTDDQAVGKEVKEVMSIILDNEEHAESNLFSGTDDQAAGKEVKEVMSIFLDNEEDAEPTPLTGTDDQAVGKEVKEVMSIFLDNEEDAEPTPLTGTDDQAVGKDIKEMIKTLLDNEEDAEPTLLTGTVDQAVGNELKEMMSKFPATNADNEEDAEPTPLTGTDDQAVGKEVNEVMSIFLDNEEDEEPTPLTGTDDQAVGNELKEMMSKFQGEMKTILQAKKRRCQKSIDAFADSIQQKTEDFLKVQHEQREKIYEDYSQELFNLNLSLSTTWKKVKKEREELAMKFQQEQKSFRENQVVCLQNIKASEDLFGEYLKTLKDLDGNTTAVEQRKLKSKMVFLKSELIRESRKLKNTSVLKGFRILCSVNRNRKSNPQS